MKVLLASFEPRRDRTPAGWRFVQKPTRHASSRQFESQPTKTPGRYEPTLNARPNPPSGRSVRVGGEVERDADQSRRSRRLGARRDQGPVPLERLSTIVKIPLPLGASRKHDRPSPLPSADGSPG